MSKEVKKEIKIPKVEDKVEDLLQKAKIETKKPILKKEEEKKPKRKRGRPKKRKVEWDYDKYKEHPISKTIDSFMLRVGNGILTVIKKEPLSKDEKLKDEHCQIGEAITYTMEYYGLEITHPIWILIIVVGMYSWAIIDRGIKIKEEQTAIQKAIERA